MFKIGICGAAGAGKSTVAELLQAALHSAGSVSTVQPLAETLHRTAASLFGGAEQVADRNLKEQRRSVLLESTAEYSVVDVMVQHITSASEGWITGDDAFLMTLTLFKELEGRGALSSEGNGGVVALISPREFMQVLGTECGRNLFGEDFWRSVALKRCAAHGADIVIVPDVRFKDEAADMDYLVSVVRPGHGAGTHASELDTPWLVSKADYRVPNHYSLDALDACAEVLAGVILKRLQQTQKEQ